MISQDEVASLARLSRIAICPRDLDRFAPHLQQMLAYVAKLNELDTSNVAPMAHVLPLRNVMRSDVNEPSLSNAAALQSAPDVVDGFFHVPAIIE